MRTSAIFFAAAAAALMLAACRDVPEDATYAKPEKEGVYYEEPTAAQECQDAAGGPECPAPRKGPVEQPERVN